MFHGQAWGLGLATQAAQKGMRTLAEHGQMLAKAGITSAAEIARVTAG